MSDQETGTADAGTVEIETAETQPEAGAAAERKAEPRLFMMLFEATAGAKSGMRLGARHAIMVFMVASERKFAMGKALKALEVIGWSGLQLRKGADITGQKAFEDKALNTMARKALEKGAAFLVYKDEIKGQA